MFEITGKYSTAKVMIDALDEECVSQISAMLDNEVFTNPVRIMPDAHKGKGSVIGFTMPLSNKIIPNVIGVDIGCGMNTVNLGKNLNISFLTDNLISFSNFNHLIIGKLGKFRWQTFRIQVIWMELLAFFSISRFDFNI